MNKGLATIWIVLIVILALAVGAIGGYFYFKNKEGNKSRITSSSTPTSAATTSSKSALTTTPSAASSSSNNTEVYSNDIWKFSFKYPSTYSITNDNLPKQNDKETGTREGLELTKNQDGNAPTLMIYVNAAGWGYENFDKEIANEKIYISGKDTELYYGEDVYANTRLAIVNYQVDNGMNYSISLFHKGTDNYLPEFKQILSTFQFIK